MRGKTVPIFKCNDGDIVAEDIINDYGATVVVRGTLLNPYIIYKLIGHGIKEVYIFDSSNGESLEPLNNLEFIVFREKYSKNINAMKKIINELAMGKGLDQSLVESVSNAICSEVTQTGSVLKFLQTLKALDEYTYTHCINTAFYAMLIGKWMGFSEKRIKKLIQSGLLHDIGKVNIPLEILNKKGSLTKEEFENIKKHTIWGYGIVQEADDVDPEVKKAILLHHERVDRSGYPFSASPDCVGVYAKVIAVADVYDAMTSERIYKKRVTPFNVFEMFKTEGMGMFDTSVLSAFLKGIAPYYTGIDVVLNTGDIGKVVYIPPQEIINPVILTKGNYIDLSRNSSLKILKIVQNIERQNKAMV